MGSDWTTRVSGGPLALVEDGDMIEIDIPNARLDLHVGDSELARCKAD